MKHTRLFSRFAAALLAILLLSVSFVPAWADGNTGTVTVAFPIEGTVYRVYHVGNMVGDAFVPDAAFSGADLSDLVAAASAMADMVTLGNAAAPIASGTIASGKTIISDLPAGVFLLVGEEREQNNIRYYPTPALFSMPQKDDSGNLIWEANVSGKYEMETNIAVRKVWVGDQVVDRPNSVTVHLMLDGKPYGDPVVLDYTNNWSYVWEHLPPKNWYVTEDENPRYTCTINRNGNLFTIVNTWKRIPQTGQLWWPVSAMTVAGLAFIAIGLIRRRKSEDNA